MTSKLENAKKARELNRKADKNFAIAYIFGFICFLCIIYVVIKLLNYLYPNIDLYKRPFLTDVWGTVADWVMIIVTTITAALLIMSLRAQKKANDIAYKNYLLSIKPKFSVNDGIVNAVGGNLGFIIELELHNNGVYCFEVINFDSNYLSAPSQYTHADTMFPGAKYYLVLDNNITTIIGSNAEAHFLAEIAFTDIDGNYYRQLIFTTIINTVYITDPESLEM